MQLVGEVVAVVFLAGVIVSLYEQSCWPLVLTVLAILAALRALAGLGGGRK